MHFYRVYFRRWDVHSDAVEDLPRQKACEHLRGSVRDREDSNVLTWKDKMPTVAMPRLDRLFPTLDPEMWIRLGKEHAVIKFVAKALDQGLERNEIHHEIALYDLPLYPNLNLVIMAMKWLTGPVGEDEEMGRREVEILLVDSDGEGLAHTIAPCK